MVSLPWVSAIPDGKSGVIEMYKAFSPGNMGLRDLSLEASIEMAKSAGFAGLEVYAPQISDAVNKRGIDSVKELFATAHLKPAGFPLPVEWRKDDNEWLTGLASLPKWAAAASAVGCARCFTWVLPCSEVRPLGENILFHIERFKPIANILNDYGIDLGLEFIGGKIIRESQKFPFIYNMQHMLDLGKQIGPNVGLLLDCFHWYTAGETVADLELLLPKQIVYVHVNDAYAGRTPDQQIDNQRGLPGSTGVIDISGFMSALQKIGYDGPVVPEPFGNAATWAKQSLDAIWSASRDK